MFRPPGDCPNCGEEVPARARACPHCGATADAGWNDASAYDGLDLPDEAFEDDDTAPQPVRRPGLHPAWMLVAVLLLGSLVAWIWIR